MPICEKIRARHREVCIGDMRNQINIYVRDLKAPNFVEASEMFTLVASPWAALKTTRGDQFFDSTNTLTEYTHEWALRFVPNLSLNSWIQFQSQWYKVFDIEDLEQRHEFLIIKTILRGTIDKIVNEA